MENKKGKKFPKKPTKKILWKTAEDAVGNISDMAGALGVSRQTIYAWLKNDKALSDRIDELRKGEMIDLAKEGLRFHLEQKSEKSIHFVLERLARQEGFGRFVQIQDKSKFEDQLKDATDDELIEMLNQTTKKINDGR